MRLQVVSELWQLLQQVRALLLNIKHSTLLHLQHTHTQHSTLSGLHVRARLIITQHQLIAEMSVSVHVSLLCIFFPTVESPVQLVLVTVV